MLFNNIYQSDITTAFKPKLILFACSWAILSAILSSIYVRKCIKDESKHSVMIVGIFRSNFAIIGLPLVQSLCPGEDSSAIAVLVAIIVALYNVISVIILELFSGKKASPWKILKEILKNPLIIGSAAGIIFMFLKIKLPYFLQKSVKDVATIASPLMIFLLGAFFDFTGVKKNVKHLSIVVLGKLVVIPAVILGCAILMGFRGIELAGIIGMTATSTAVSSFTMAQQMNGDAELAGQIIVVTSFLCPFSVFAWSMILKTFGLL